MSALYYSIIIGIRSAALLSARQIYGPSTDVIAFGWDKINFKSPEEKADMHNTFTSLGVILLE